MGAQALQDYYDSSPNVRRLALLALCLILIIVSMSLSAINIAIPAIGDELKVDAEALSWIPTAMLWGNVVFLLPIGRLADRYGRKRLFGLGVVLYIVSSALIFITYEIYMLLLVRVLQGIAGSMVYGTGLAIIGAIYANSSRGQALGLVGSSVYFGLTMGPLIGGWLIMDWGWRSIIWMPAIVAAAALVVLFTFVKGEWRTPDAPKLDWQGLALMALAVTLFLLGMGQISEPFYMTMAVSGLVLFALFIRHQLNRENPLLRIRAVKANRMLNRSLLAGFFVYGSSFSLVFLLSMYLQYVHAMTPIEAGKIVMIQTLVMMVLSPIAGRLSDKYEARYLSTLGCALFAIGYLLMSQVGSDTSIGYIITVMVLVGVGFGLFSAPNNNAAIGAVPADRLSIASALINLARTTGNMFSSALVMVLFSVIIGDVAITPEQHPRLLLVIEIAMLLSTAYVVIAGVFSYRRGLTH
ncbi:MAG TPA: MFS transporter [Oceanospirillaceae bacterium]|nr:MFS transporter [Oceanospirillaceae bacterium]